MTTKIPRLGMARSVSGQWHPVVCASADTRRTSLKVSTTTHFIHNLTGKFRHDYSLELSRALKNFKQIARSCRSGPGSGRYECSVGLPYEGRGVGFFAP